MLLVPATLTITNAVYAMDGGSRGIYLRDGDGNAHTLSIGQHRIPSNFASGGAPGALVFDEVLVPVRSETERALLRALKVATFSFETLRSVSEVERTQPAGRRLVLGQDVAAEVAAADRGVEASLRHAVAEVISFVESQDYIDVARRFGRLP